MMKRVSRSANNEEGYILMMGICIMMVLMLFGVALAVMGLQEFDLSSRTKLMDQAYLIADAGVNSAAVAIENTPASPAPVYPVFPATASGITIPFGGGNFTYKIYQSEQNTDSTYKVIQSTGTITKQGKTVDRTILARIVIGAGGQDYDASFDYLMYNGMDSNGDGVSEGGTWSPTDLRFTAILSGQFGFDGFTPYMGHSPKGCFYAAGSINIPASIVGDLNISGDIVATDDITLKNSWGLNITGVSGIKVTNGNVVAGLDGSGNANVTAAYNAGFNSSALSVSGNVCAANNVTVSSSSGVAAFTSPLVVGGIRAGGNAVVTSNWSIGQPLQVTTNGIISGNNTSINTSGFIGGVTVNGNISAGTESNIAIFSGAPVGGGQGVNLNANGLGCGVTVGHIRSNGRVDLAAAYDSASVTTQRITAGNDTSSATGGTGVTGTVKTLSGWILTPSLNINGQVTSAGAVNLSGNCVASWFPSQCNITTQGITAGSSNGTASTDGIVFGGNAFGNYNLGALQAVGNITMNNSDGGKFTSGSIYSGGNVSLGISSSWLTNIGDDSINVNGAISVAGNLTTSTPRDTNLYNGAITVVGSIDIRSKAISWEPVTSKIQVAQSNNVYAGGTVTIVGETAWLGAIDTQVWTGNVYSIGNISLNAGDPIYVGTYYAGNASNLTSTIYIRTKNNINGNNPTIGNVWGTGKVTISHDEYLSGDVYAGTVKSATCARFEPFGDAFYGTDIYCHNGDGGSISAPTYELQSGRSWGNIEPNGGSDWTHTDWYAPPTGNPGSATGVTAPTVATPSQHAKPAVPTVRLGGNVDVLGEANLSAPVKLLKPNWAYFETLAQQDDVANGPTTKICPNPNCRKTNPATNTVCGQNGNPPNGCGTSLTSVSPGPAHMIYENGPGDQDHGTAGIQFKWDPTTPYSSNEVIYNGDPNVNVYITSLNWNNQASTFAGTIVSRGNVYITANTPMTWLVGTGQNLNIVSGWDIVDNTSGVSLIEKTDSQMHLWAYHDINLDNLNINLVGINSFLGSFTAGDKVVFNSNSIWDKTTFKWSRWALDPVAWAPPFQVLDWKEL